MRLITFGCSITFGNGLKDCFDVKLKCMGDEPSHYAWPQLVANKLGLECVNLSMSGSSNKLILKRIQDFDFCKNDLVIIMWTYTNRYTIFHNDGFVEQGKEASFTSIGAWVEEKMSKAYYRFLYDTYDGCYDLYTRANYAKLYLDSLGIKNHHLLPMQADIIDSWEWNKVKFLPFTMRSFKHLGLALDNKHPGHEAQIQYAERIYSFINKTN